MAKRRAVFTGNEACADAQVPIVQIILGSGGAVQSVNGQTGEVVLTAADVGALPDTTVLSYVYTQETPATLWTIDHNLKRFPSITVVDNSGTPFVGTVDYIDENQVTVRFSQPLAGKAYLN